MAGEVRRLRRRGCGGGAPGPVPPAGPTDSPPPGLGRKAAIGACYLHHGFEVTSDAVESAFMEQIELASETLLDFKSALQELLARDGSQVTYDVTREAGPPHDRRFEVAARVDAEVIGRGEGRSKKAAEQAAAAEALERIRGLSRR